jgi:hypothetical protein|tara:strand:+ start:320 stop:532 length:213 start_codon:yes stop_codon:yes gene_type:complete
MLKSKHWSEITEEGVEVEVGNENQASRDQHEFGHTDGKRTIQKEKHRIPRGFKNKIEEAIWIAQQKAKNE